MSCRDMLNKVGWLCYSFIAVKKITQKFVA
jgi:hypothetical protein